MLPFFVPRKGSSHQHNLKIAVQKSTIYRKPQTSTCLMEKSFLKYGWESKTSWRWDKVQAQGKPSPLPLCS